MTRDRLAKLVKHPSTSDREAITALEEIVARFPYYSNGHILLTLQYRLLDHIRYDSQLRKTSVYVPDRSILRRLVLAEEDVPFPDSIQVSKDPLAKVETVDETPTANETKKLLVPEVFGKLEETPEVHSADAKLDPREVIEQRLKELKQQDQLIRDQLIETTNLETPIIVPIKGEPLKDVEVTVQEPIPPSPSQNETSQELVEQEEPKKKDADVVVQDKNPASPSPKSTSQELVEEEEPKNFEFEIPKSKPDEFVSEPTEKQEAIAKPIEKSEPRSFGDWLKALPAQDNQVSKNDNSNPGAPIKPAGDYFGIDPANSTDSIDKATREESIIDKFIREEPRIVPSKSEFYSPGNMARKSAQDHEDLISETLARIYAQQGNIAKAISTYERLALKLPQKKAYFASLIEDLLSRS